MFRDTPRIHLTATTPEEPSTKGIEHETHYRPQTTTYRTDRHISIPANPVDRPVSPATSRFTAFQPRHPDHRGFGYGAGCLCSAMAPVLADADATVAGAIPAADPSGDRAAFDGGGVGYLIACIDSVASFLANASAD